MSDRDNFVTAQSFAAVGCQKLDAADGDKTE